MSGSEPAYVMLDANALMHFQRPDQIDWPAMLKCQAVHLVVTPMLMRELEEQKIKNRSRKLRDRAQSIVLWIASFIESDAPPDVRKGVKLLFVRHSPQLDFATHKLSRTVYDDELIASAIEFREEHGSDVLFFTADTGLRLKLPEHGFRAIPPPEHLKLPTEPDEMEKENTKLKAELSRHLHRLPRLEFSFLDGSAEYELPTMREAVEAVEAEGIPQFGTSPRDYKKYVEDLERWKAQARFATGFRMRLENTGNAVATNIKIELDFPKFVQAVRLRDQPKVPTIMSQTWLRTNLALPNEEEPTYSDYKDAVSFSIANLVHNRIFESELIWLRFADESVVQDFSSEYLITCVEDIEPRRGTLDFTVGNWQRASKSVTDDSAG